MLRRPLVLNSGRVAELPSGDSIVGGNGFPYFNVAAGVSVRIEEGQWMPYLDSLGLEVDGEIILDGLIYEILPKQVVLDSGTLSSTLFDFSLPTNLRYFELVLSAVSTNSTSPVIIQLKDTVSGAITSGYVGAVGAVAAASAAGSAFSTGFETDTATAAASVYDGILRFSRRDDDSLTWTCEGKVVRTDSMREMNVYGRILMPNGLNGLRLTTITGTPVFDGSSRAYIKYGGLQ